jgi:hypothetical protein
MAFRVLYSGSFGARLASAMSSERTATEILAYLHRYPDAQDTFEGILEWWLLERRVQRGTAEVEAALRQLVTTGHLQERRGPDGRVHYRLNPDRGPTQQENP